MILKVVREKETKYYVPTQIQAMTVSAVYNSDDMYDDDIYCKWRFLNQ